jgi:hypothetical protein
MKGAFVVADFITLAFEADSVKAGVESGVFAGLEPVVLGATGAIVGES